MVNLNGNNMPLVRLQKHIADLGICSRRKAETLIVAGKVKVNGQTASTLGIKIDPTIDKIEVDRPQTTNTSQPYLYILLNKPFEYSTDTNHSTSPGTNNNILNLLVSQNHVSKDKKTINEKITTISQLDADCEGLVILTNDEQFIALSKEQYDEYEKEYEVTIDHALARDAKKVLEKGMILNNEELPGIDIKKEFNKGRMTIVTIIIKQEKPRQIRQMFERLGYNIISIKRTRINTLKLGTLSPGQWMLVKKDKL